MAGIAAKSYSDALFALAQEEQKLDTFKADVCMMDEQLKAYPDFMRVLTHPKIHKEEKKQTLASVFGSEVDHMVLNFAKLLIDKSRFQSFHDITREFVKQYNKVNNIEVAHVRTAKKLEDAEIKRLKSMLEEKLSKTVELHIQEDPDLLAGLRIKINDMVLDNTARSRMDNLKQLAQSEPVQES